jgi:hypothetical protein
MLQHLPGSRKPAGAKATADQQSAARQHRINDGKGLCRCQCQHCALSIGGVCAGAHMHSVGQ